MKRIMKYLGAILVLAIVVAFAVLSFGGLFGTPGQQGDTAVLWRNSITPVDEEVAVLWRNSIIGKPLEEVAVLWRNSIIGKPLEEVAVMWRDGRRA